MEEKFIDTDTIKDYLLENLLKNGFVPRDEELDVIADIMFDFLLEYGVLEEVEDENDY